MSDFKAILKTKFIEHFLFDYTDKDDYEVRMLSEIFEGIYHQKDKHFKSESKYWQVFRCLADQQAIIDDLRSQLNNMEACYIEKKKQVEAVNAVLMNWQDEYTEHTHQHECTTDAVLRTCITELRQALRGANA